MKERKEKCTIDQGAMSGALEEEEEEKKERGERRKGRRRRRRRKNQECARIHAMHYRPSLEGVCGSGTCR